MSGSSYRSPSERSSGRRTSDGALVDRARYLAALLLSSSGDRWLHTRAVARRAAQAAPAVAHEVGAAGAEALVAAAWLHDVGYAASLVRTGYHAVDGAVHLRETGWPEEVVLLVAHHSGARFVARARGLGAEMAAFDDERGWSGPAAQALTWADQTCGPTGGRVTVTQRLAEVQERHGPHSPLVRCHGERGPSILVDAAATVDLVVRHRDAVHSASHAVLRAVLEARRADLAG